MCRSVVRMAPTANLMQKIPLRTVCVSMMSCLADSRPKYMRLRSLRASGDSEDSSSAAAGGTSLKTDNAKHGFVTSSSSEDSSTNLAKMLFISMHCSFHVSACEGTGRCLDLRKNGVPGECTYEILALQTIGEQTRLSTSGIVGQD